MIEKMTTTDDYLILDGAVVVGNVKMGKNVSVWYNAVIRGDSNSITIGDRCNVQDCCVLHTDAGHPLVIGNDVAIGHGAVVHGCEIGNNVLIGMGSTILSGAKIGNNCLIGAGALITGKMDIPDGSLVMGSPAKVIRPCNEAELALIEDDVKSYMAHAKQYRVELYSNE